MKTIQKILAISFFLIGTLIFITEFNIWFLILTILLGILLFITSIFVYKIEVKEENRKKQNELYFENICRILFSKPSKECNAKEITIALDHLNQLKIEQELENNNKLKSI